MATGIISLTRLAKGVDENFRSDWQYLILASKINSALSLTTIFSLFAIVTRFSNLREIGHSALYCFLLASILYLIAISVIIKYAPAFLRDYPNYNDFKARENSHRWILWEFYHEIQQLNDGFELLPETVSKKLSTNINSIGRSRLPVNKAFERFTAEKIVVAEYGGGMGSYNIKLYRPFNFDRDLLLGFSTLDKLGNEKRYVLPIREKDKDLEVKCKELFWILFTAAAKEHPKARRLAWFLVRLSGLLLLAAAAFAIYNVALVERVQEFKNCCIHLVDLRSAIFGSEGFTQ